MAHILIGAPPRSHLPPHLARLAAEPDRRWVAPRLGSAEHDLVAPEPMLPAEPRALSPVQLLMAAILEQSINDVVDPQAERHGYYKGRAYVKCTADEVRAAALAWVECDDVEHPLSFRSCCEALGFVTELVRARIVSGTAAAVQSVRPDAGKGRGNHRLGTLRYRMRRRRAA